MADTEVKLANIDEMLSTTGKPREGGCLWVHFNPDSATLPTDAATDMSTLEGWYSLGDLTEDGVVFGKSATKNTLSGHQGHVVISEVSKVEQTVGFTLIEPNRPAAAKLYNGASSVTAGKDGSVATIEDDMTAKTKVAIVEDVLESNGYLRRTVVPKMSVDTFTDESHKQGAFIAYGVTGTVIKMADKAAKYTYRAKPAAA